MKISNAIKKLEKAGYEVTEYRPGSFRAVNGRQVVGFHKNGHSEDATAFHTTTTDASEYNTPLFGWPSLKSIIDSQRDSVEAEKARANAA